MATVTQTPTFSILLPTYNGARYIRPTIKNILSQSFTDFELIINDDCSTDDTLKIIRSYKDPRIKIFVNVKNCGYSRNLEQGRTHLKGKYIFLMGQDDILLSDALKQTHQAFTKNLKIGAVTRPYYWFFDDINKPVRYKVSFKSNTTKVVKITDRHQSVIRVFDSLDQLSGLAYRADLFKVHFHPDIFPSHIYPFADIFHHHPVAYLPQYTIAVRITSSQTRFLSSIYNKSPLQSWVDMVTNLDLPRYIISEFIAINYIGLVQIKNYSSYKNLLREIFLLIKYRPSNIFSPAFWFFSLGTMIIPPSILIPMVDWYKNQVYSKNIPKIDIQYAKWTN